MLAMATRRTAGPPGCGDRLTAAPPPAARGALRWGPDCGGRLGRLPSSWIRELENGAEAADIIITGMDLDPLGREIAHRYETNLLSSHPVHLLPEGAGLGIRFSEQPDPGPG